MQAEVRLTWFLKDFGKKLVIVMVFFYNYKSGLLQSVKQSIKGQRIHYCKVIFL